MEYKFKIQYAFTLAEVLITLLIIGVVASLVIPAIIQDTQDAELKAAWKKAYADVAQATKLIIIDNGVGFKNLGITNNALRDLYLQHLNYTKKCNQTALVNCWDNGITVVSGDSMSDNSGAILTNGAYIIFDYDSNACTSNINIQFATGVINACGGIDVDVNGNKGPNKVGKDIFGLYILENSVLPYGTQGDGQENTCSTTGGVGCSAKYLFQ
jgi:prepilin-type N-terminal cleavage/methylation domain-containing protein